MSFQRAALLLLDFINPFDFPEAEKLIEQTEAIVDPVQRVAQAFRQKSLPVIYVNDNFGRWRSNFEEIAELCEGGQEGSIAERLHPKKEDYFVLKPHRSGFYGTPLELLLGELECTRLLLSGITTDMCVLATANDACMREFDTIVLQDGTASFDKATHQSALDIMQKSLQVKVMAAEQVAAQGDAFR